MISEGKQIEVNLSRESIEKSDKKIKACQKAIKELTEICEKKSKALERNKERRIQWEGIKRNWSHIHIDPKFEEFQKAKVKQWQDQLAKVEYEQRATLYSIVANISILARQVFIVGAVMCGFGIVVIPMLFNIGLDVVGAGCDIRSFVMKRSLRKMKVKTINLGDYVGSLKILTPQEDASHLSRATGTTIYQNP